MVRAVVPATKGIAGWERQGFGNIAGAEEIEDE